MSINLCNSYNSGSIINLIYKTSFTTLQLHMLLFTVDVTTLLGSPASEPESVVLAVSQTRDDLICSIDLEAVSG